MTTARTRLKTLDVTLNEARAFAEAGPAFTALGPIDWNGWHRAAETLATTLGDSSHARRRIHHLVLPVLFFCAQRAKATTRRPLMVGLQAPQGAGKTTLVGQLRQLLPALGLRAVGVSIDDFYLTRDEQLQLAAAHPGNPYLEHRGYPGTHDVALGDETLAALADGRSVAVPAYDKSAHGGRGDRRPRAQWQTVEPPVDVVLVEGWMLGFTPVEAPHDANLVEPNRRLAEYAAWLRHLNAFVVLRALDTRDVLRWRVEAEEAMKARGAPGLSRAAIEDYVRRFLPAYETYASRPVSVSPQLVLTLDATRGVVAQ